MSEKLQKKLTCVLTSRRETIEKLKELRDKIQEEERRHNIGKIAYSSTGVVGGGLAIAGLVLMPVTLGTSLGISIAGAVLNMASGIASISHGIAAYVVIKKTSEEAEKLLNKHMSLIDELAGMVKKGKIVIITGIKGVLVVKEITDISLKSVAVNAIRAPRVVDVVETVATGVASTSSRFFTIAGGVLARIGIVIEIRTIFNSSRNLANHFLHEKVVVLNSVISQLESELNIRNG